MSTLFDPTEQQPRAPRDDARDKGAPVPHDERAPDTRSPAQTPTPDTFTAQDLSDTSPRNEETARERARRTADATIGKLDERITRSLTGDHSPSHGDCHMSRDEREGWRLFTVDFQTEVIAPCVERNDAVQLVGGGNPVIRTESGATARIVSVIDGDRIEALVPDLSLFTRATDAAFVESRVVREPEVFTMGPKPDPVPAFLVQTTENDALGVPRHVVEARFSPRVLDDLTEHFLDRYHNDDPLGLEADRYSYLQDMLERQVRKDLREEVRARLREETDDSPSEEPATVEELKLGNRRTHRYREDRPMTFEEQVDSRLSDLSLSGFAEIHTAHRHDDDLMGGDVRIVTLRVPELPENLFYPNRDEMTYREQTYEVRIASTGEIELTRRPPANREEPTE